MSDTNAATDCSTEFNSLESWDYFIELECLKGSTDLQLAAELGKTLLERNKHLEMCVREQQGVIDDQLSQIQHLSRQSEAVRQLHDSRLRVYEQLEQGTQQLESENSRLHKLLKQLQNRINNMSVVVRRQADCQTDLINQHHQLKLSLSSDGSSEVSRVTGPSQTVRNQLGKCSVAVQCTGSKDFMVEMVRRARLQRHLDESQQSELIERTARQAAELQRDSSKQECERLSHQVRLLKTHLAKCCRRLSNLSASKPHCLKESDDTDVFSTEHDHERALSDCTSHLTEHPELADDESLCLMNELDSHCHRLLEQHELLSHQTSTATTQTLRHSLSLQEELRQCSDTLLSPEFASFTERRASVQTETPIGRYCSASTNQRSPEYRRLFSELFRVLKQSVPDESSSRKDVLSVDNSPDSVDSGNCDWNVSLEECSD